ncbi:hypothetical protein ABPG72_012204 [Tetrahymena utriculariae]
MLKPKYPEKVYCWAGISFKGVIRLQIFEEQLTGQLYEDILKNVLIPDSKTIFKENNWFLLQDKDLKYTCKLVTGFFEKHNIMLIDFLTNSPDLNVIENLCGLLKSKIS